jgi:hypothetical protein
LAEALRILDLKLGEGNKAHAGQLEIAVCGA